MPSGAKKRKAAKKKKEKESSSNSNQPVYTVNSHGDDDLNHQDDKDMDGGELSSPASQDHHSHQQHFTEEEEEVEKGEDSSNFVFIEGVKNEGVEEQKMVAEEGSVVQVEKELKHEGESEKKDIVVEYDELPEKSYDGGVSGSSSSSRSSSDDESRGFEKSKATVLDASVDLVKESDSLSESPAQAIHVPLEEQVGDSVVQTSIVGLEKVPLLNDKVEVNTSAPLDILEASHVSESEMKENGENLKSAEEGVVFSAAGLDAVSDREALEAIVRPAENAAETSDTKGCKLQETDDKLTLSYSVPSVNDNNGAEHEKYSEVPKPVVALTLHPVQTTSWKSCCGLFELFTGSGR